MVSWKKIFHSSKEDPQLELPGDVPVLSKYGHVPEASKNKSQGSCVFLHTYEVQKCFYFGQSTISSSNNV